MKPTILAIAATLRTKIAECVPDFGPHINQSVDEYQEKQSAHMQAISLARYLSENLAGVSRVEFLNACGVKP